MSTLVSRAFWSLYGRLAWTANTPPSRERQIREVVAEITARAPGARVLDAGCGTGDFSLALVREGCRVTAIDSARGMVTVAGRKLAGQALASVGCVDLGRPLPYENRTFDVVLLISVLHLLPDPGRLLAEIGRVLRPDGAIYLLYASTPTDRSALAVAREKARGTRRRPVAFALLWLKTWAEQRRRSGAWSLAELRELLASHGFAVQRELSREPLLISLVRAGHRAEPAHAMD